MTFKEAKSEYLYEKQNVLCKKLYMSITMHQIDRIPEFLWQVELSIVFENVLKKFKHMRENLFQFLHQI